jgi:hypothetical protein
LPASIAFDEKIILVFPLFRLYKKPRKFPGSPSASHRKFRSKKTNGRTWNGHDGGQDPTNASFVPFRVNTFDNNLIY